VKYEITRKPRLIQAYHRSVLFVPLHVESSNSYLFCPNFLCLQAKHVIEDAELSRPKGEEPAKPASRERQREILGRMPTDQKKTRIGMNKAMVAPADYSQPNKRSPRIEEEDDYFNEDDEDY
jgi:hypothetical protein